MSPVTDIFGDIKSAAELEEATISILELWMETYLREMEIQVGIPIKTVARPRSYSRKNRVDDTYVEEQLPKIIVICPGLSDPPRAEGTGDYRATWNLGVAVLVSAKDEQSTRALAQFYAAVVRAILLQRPSLGGKATGVTWQDEQYDEFEPDAGSTRSLCAAQSYFLVEMEYVTNRLKGPAEPIGPDPDDQPGSHWPIVEEVIITFEKEDLFE